MHSRRVGRNSASVFRLPRASPEDGLDDFAQRLLILSFEPAEDFADDGFLGGEDHRLEDGRFQESGTLPVLDEGLAESERGPDLAGDGHQDHVGPLALIGAAADHDGRPLLRSLLVGERKTHQHDIAEASV